MALYHKWDVKNGFAFVLQFFSLISDGLGGVSAQHGIELYAHHSTELRDFVQCKSRPLCGFFGEGRRIGERKTRQIVYHLKKKF